MLTSDQTPDVPHFWHKKLAEDKLEQLGVPFVALRPGAFLDQVASMAGDPVDKGRMVWIGKATIPLTFVHTSDLAAYLAAAVDADAEAGERINIGWDRPVSMREVADVMGSRAGKKIKVWAVPSAVAHAAGAVAGRFMPLIADMAAMFRWFETGTVRGRRARHVRQGRVVGVVVGRFHPPRPRAWPWCPRARAGCSAATSTV
ncbi:NmrA family NAD(P)-binding protein [Streptomyces botrytidirepellens]|uniref:NmrA family NAD(P)-binding protein n=1 Tax=Streptomyces botrytidirepellens TaxID=2486417 RepID=UPI0024821DB1|nr:NmrA family NAD(P)-binding protein [Streptomyces botrytidirepellens]